MPNSSLSLFNNAINSDAAIGSRCDVGSSKISSLGCMTITDAKLSICFCPPDNSDVFLPYQLFIPKKFATSATLLLISAGFVPIFSRPKANSFFTLSVTICISGFCITNPISQADSLLSSLSISTPLNFIKPLISPTGEISGLSSFKKVVLPQPVPPKITINSPDDTDKLIFVSTFLFFG